MFVAHDFGDEVFEFGDTAHTDTPDTHVGGSIVEWIIAVEPHIATITGTFTHIAVDICQKRRNQIDIGTAALAIVKRINRTVTHKGNSMRYAGVGCGKILQKHANSVRVDLSATPTIIDLLDVDGYTGGALGGAICNEWRECG